MSINLILTLVGNSGKLKKFRAHLFHFLRKKGLLKKQKIKFLEKNMFALSNHPTSPSKRYTAKLKFEEIKF